MQEEEKSVPEQPEIDFERAIESAEKIAIPNKGDRVKGTIISISENAVLLDCGMKSEASIDPKEIKDEKIGEAVEGIITQVEPEFVVTLNLSEGVASNDTLQTAFESKLPVTGKITNTIKGGFEVYIGTKRAFLPISHLDTNYVEDTKSYLNKIFEFEIIEYAPAKRKFVISRTALLKKENARLAEGTWKKIEVDAVLDGKVQSIQKFGAFIDLGGVEGLLHISELSQSFTAHPSEILKVGQDVTVKIIKLDREKNRVALSMKKLIPDPWESFTEAHEAGGKIEGKIVRHADFGLFIELIPGVDGLLHISQLLPDTDKNDQQYAVNETISGWIRSIDSANKKVSITLLEPNPDKTDVWENLPSIYSVDAELKGKIEESTKFGVFVELEEGLTGLIPQSEIKRAGIKDASKHFIAGNQIDVRITSLESERKRISLTLAGANYEKKSASPSKSRQRSNIKKQETSPSSSISDFGAALAAALNKK